MVVSAYMLVVVYGERSVGDRNCVWLRGDNEGWSRGGGEFYPRQERGLELFLRHPWIVDALKGVTCSHG